MIEMRKRLMAAEGELQDLRERLAVAVSNPCAQCQAEAQYWKDRYTEELRDGTRLRKALGAAQGEAYLGTLDSDEVPTPLEACENVISVCLNALAPIPDALPDEDSDA